MRLWSLSPQYLDVKGLTALWREALLARKVLLGETKGYRNHPQLIRFREAYEALKSKNRLEAYQLVEVFLFAVWLEADSRGYRYDRSKLLKGDAFYESKKGLIAVSRGQVGYEVEHLKRKLEIRDPNRLGLLPVGGRGVESNVALNPIFYMVEGGIADWERVSD